MFISSDSSRFLPNFSLDCSPAPCSVLFAPCLEVFPVIPTVSVTFILASVTSKYGFECPYSAQIFVVLSLESLHPLLVFVDDSGLSG